MEIANAGAVCGRPGCGREIQLPAAKVLPLLLANDWAGLRRLTDQHHQCPGKAHTN